MGWEVTVRGALHSGPYDRSANYFVIFHIVAHTKTIVTIKEPIASSSEQLHTTAVGAADS